MYTLMLCILVHTFNFISITVFLPFGDSCIMSCKKSSLRTLEVSIESLLYKDMRGSNFPTGSGGKLQMPK